MSNSRCYRRYKGVAIYHTKVMVPGSNYDFSDSGKLVSRKAEFETYYHWADGALCDTVDEVKEDIDTVLLKAESVKIPTQDMVKELNTFKEN